MEAGTVSLSLRVDLLPPPPHPTSAKTRKQIPRTKLDDLAQDIASSCSIRNVLLNGGLYCLGDDNHSAEQFRHTKKRLCDTAKKRLRGALAGVLGSDFRQRTGP